MSENDLPELVVRLLIATEQALSQWDAKHNPDPDDCLRCYSERKLRERCREVAARLGMHSVT